MRHRINKLRLNRFTSWRNATLISLARNLLIHQRIRTTRIKAKMVVPLAESLITLGKKDNLVARRKAFSILQDHKLVRLLFSGIAPCFNNRKGGYCRILPFSFRRGDGGRLVILELTEKRKEEKKPPKSEQAQAKPKQEVSQAEVKPQAEPPKAVAKPKRKLLGGLRKIFKKDKRSP
jgi:large subunit ribosomal protein L17